LKKTEFDTNITSDQARWVIGHMRKSDIDEIWSANRQTPADAIMQGLSVSVFRWVVRIGALPVAICGVAPLGSNDARFGVPWLLGTDGIGMAPVSFFRASRRALDSCYPRFHHLVNFVDARNVLSLKWLGWLGFKIHPAREYGADQLPFHLAEKEFSECAQ